MIRIILARDIEKPNQVERFIKKLIIGDELSFKNCYVQKIGNDKYQLKKPDQCSEIITSTLLIEYIKTLI